MDCFLWLKEEGPQCIHQSFFSTHMEQNEGKANVEPVGVAYMTTKRYFHSETSDKELGATRKRLSLFRDCTIFYGKKENARYWKANFCNDTLRGI